MSSDCNVCLYGSGEYSDVFAREEVKARKPYKCCECDRKIGVRELHQVCRMLFEGEWSTHRTCLVCAEIRAAFYCDGEVIGEFWSQFEDCYGELNTGCLNRLKTAAAKQYLLQRWNDWKQN